MGDIWHVACMEEGKTYPFILFCYISKFISTVIKGVKLDFGQIRSRHGAQELIKNLRFDFLSLGKDNI